MTADAHSLTRSSDAMFCPEQLAGRLAWAILVLVFRVWPLTPNRILKG